MANKNKARKPRKHKATAAGKAKIAAKRNTKISKKNEEESYMVTIPIDIIYSLNNSSSIRDCSDNYIKEESTEIKTTSSKKEDGLYLDSETRNVDYKSNCRWLEERTRSLEDVSPARTIINYEYFESNEVDFPLSSRELINLRKPIIPRQSETVTSSPTCQQPSSDERVLRHNTNFTNPVSSNLSESTRLISSPSGILIERHNEIATFSPERCSKNVSIKCQNPLRESNEQNSKYEHQLLLPLPKKRPSMDLMFAITPLNQLETSYTSVKQKRIKPSISKESPNSYEIRSSAKCTSLRTSTHQGNKNHNKWQRIRFSMSPKVSTPHASERIEDSDSDYGWEDPPHPKSKPNTSLVGISIQPEQPPSLDERALRHNITLADPVSSNFTESSLMSSPSGIVEDEERRPQIVTLSPEGYSKNVPRKRHDPLKSSNEQHSKYERKSPDHYQLLPLLSRKRPSMDLMFAMPPQNQIDASNTLYQNRQSPELKQASLSEMSNHTESKRRRRSHEHHFNDQYKRLYGVKSVKQKSPSKDLYESPNFHEISSSAKCTSLRTSTHQGNNNYNEWQRIRFSMSPEVSTSHASERIEDSDSDYGWEDPPPPKSKPNDMTWSIPKDLNREQLQGMLAKLDLLIRKEKDRYVHQLFNTDNFDKWDDDPALSNIKKAENLKIYKHFIPSNTGILEKMNLAPLVGLDTHTEFQGKGLPSHLLDLIKAEKKTISGLVIKFLMPYYHIGRIPSENIFRLIARNISHMFYGRTVDEIEIGTYIDDLFKGDGLPELHV